MYYARVFVLLIIATGVMFGPPASAQDYDTGRWSLAHGGKSAGICNRDKYFHSCFALHCGFDDGIEARFTFNVGDYVANPVARISTTGFQNQLQMRTVRAGMLSGVFPASVAADMLQALKAGRSLRFDPGFAHDFALRGSSKALGQLEDACATPELATVEALDAPPEGDETELRWNANEQQASWHMLFNTDLVGTDLETCFRDATLKNVAESTCQRRCTQNTDCDGYTYFRKTCILKSNITGQSTFQGARSAKLTQRPQPPLTPRLPGPKVEAINGLLEPGMSESTYVARLRAAAKPYGGACEMERAEMERLAAGFSASLDSRTAKAGHAMNVAWSGNTLTQALPIWFMVASDAPVRFSGIGSYALGPGALGPFGITSDRNSTRGITALYARGAGQQGTMQITPLVAGAQSVDLILTGYLRACEEVVELHRESVTFEVAPDAPTLVVHDEFDVATWTHELHLPRHNRLLRFNEERLLLLDDRDFSEVLERDGKGLSISPTGRFIQLSTPDEVIDVVDGATVARALSNEGGLWLRDDSFVVGDSAPWARVDLYSLFHDGVQVAEQNTGPSCCFAQSMATLVQVDLENNAVIVAGELGDGVWALQNRHVYDGENAGSGYAIGGKVTQDQLLRAVQRLSPVTGVPLSPLWDTFLGPEATPYIRLKPYFQHPAYIPENVRKLDAEQIASAQLDPGETVRFRGLGTYLWQAPETALDLVGSDLARVGVQLAEPLAFEPLWQPGDGPEGAFAKTYDDPSYVSLRETMQDALADHGFDLRFSRPNPEDPPWDCPDHVYPDGYGAATRAGGTYSARFDNVHRLKSATREIWILRATCDGGATGGTLRQDTFTALFDSNVIATQADVETIIDKNYTLGSSGWDTFAGKPMTWRLYGDRYLLGFPEGVGALKLYDMETRKMLHRPLDLPRGGLMVDAGLTEDLRHLVQINRDGSFEIRRIADFAVVLQGRIVDREVALWTPDYQFDATAEGASYISLRFPGRIGQYALDQFGAAMRVPGLANMVLAGQALPPVSQLSIPPQLDGTLKAESTEISVEFLQDHAQPVTLHLYQDGVLTQSETVTQASGSFRAPRLPGARWASLVAEDPGGLISLPVGTDLGPSEPQGAVSLLAVGVDQYDDPAIPDLAYAASDAELMAEALSARVGSAEVLTDAAATSDAILTALSAKVDAQAPGDHLVFFVAGHGLVDAAGAFRIAGPGTQLGDIAATALPISDITRIVAQAKGRVTILLDTCHSGAAGTGVFATNDDAVGNNRGIPPNVTVLSASRGRETSLESNQFGAGLFTASIAEVLQAPDTHDLNGNGHLDLSEFYRSVRILVATKSGGAQNPFLARNRSVGDVSAF